MDAEAALQAVAHTSMEGCQCTSASWASEPWGRRSRPIWSRRAFARPPGTARHRPSPSWSRVAQPAPRRSQRRCAAMSSSRCCSATRQSGGRAWRMGEDPQSAYLAKTAGDFMIGGAVETMAESAALVSSRGGDPAAFLAMVAETLFAAPIYRSYGPAVASGVSPGALRPEGSARGRRAHASRGKSRRHLDGHRKVDVGPAAARRGPKPVERGLVRSPLESRARSRSGSLTARAEVVADGGVALVCRDRRAAPNWVGALDD